MIALGILGAGLALLVGQDVVTSLRGGDGMLARLGKGEPLAKRKPERVQLIVLVQQAPPSTVNITSGTVKISSQKASS